jgi:hypothetical protein
MAGRDYRLKCQTRKSTRSICMTWVVTVEEVNLVEKKVAGNALTIFLADGTTLSLADGNDI